MIKSKTKNLIFILLLILLTVCFCGCAEVRAMTITNQDGSIEEQVYVSLDETAIKEKNENINAIKQDISSTAVLEAGKMLDYLSAKIEIDCIGATVETKAVLNEFRNGIEVLSNNWDNNTSNEYVITVKFKNIDVYKYYYGITEEQKTETTTEKYFFYNKVSFAGSTMYMKHNDLYNRVKTTFSVKYNDLMHSETNKLLYTYTTDLKRQHSNADYISKVGGKYYHTWVVEDVETEEILFHYNIANTGNWIIVAIGISLVVCGVLFAVSALNKNKNKSNENA